MRTNEAAPEVTPKLRSDYAPPAYAARTIDLTFELAEDGALEICIIKVRLEPRSLRDRSAFPEPRSKRDPSLRVW